MSDDAPFLVVGIASKEKLTHATHSALRRSYEALPIDYAEDIEPVGGLVLARNQIAGRVLRSIDREGNPYARPPTGVLLVDDDVGGFTAADIMRIVTSGEDVVGGPLPSRQFEPRTLLAAIKRGVPLERLHYYLSPSLMRFLDDGRVPVRNGHLCEVKFVSTGFLYLSRRALERMAAELAGSVAHIEGRDILTIFDFAVDEKGEWIGEDVGFCLRWRALGGRVFADMGTALHHTGTMTFFSEPLATQLADLTSRASAPVDSPT